MMPADRERDRDDLEAELARRSGSIRPPARLRVRVLDAVGRDLVREAPKRNGWLHFVSTIAAVLLIGLTLALSSTPSVSARESVSLEIDVQRNRRELRGLLPDLDEREIDCLLAVRMSDAAFRTGTVPVPTRR